MYIYIYSVSIDELRNYIIHMLYTCIIIYHNLGLEGGGPVIKVTPPKLLIILNSRPYSHCQNKNAYHYQLHLHYTNNVIVVVRVLGGACRWFPREIPSCLKFHNLP